MSNSSLDEISFDLDEKLYPLEAVQSAVYVFTDRAYVRVERASAEKLKVVMTLKADAAASVRSELRGEFDNELVHQVLRLRISDSNQKIREFIVTKALISAQPSALVAAAAPAAATTVGTCPDCVTEGALPVVPAQVDEALEKEIDRLLEEIEGGGAEADPLGVSVPWEEKFDPKNGAAKGKEAAKGKPSLRAKAPSATRPPELAAADAPAPIDKTLENEIDRLLAEIEGDGVKTKVPAKGRHALKAKTTSKAKKIRTKKS